MLKKYACICLLFLLFVLGMEAQITVEPTLSFPKDGDLLTDSTVNLHWDSIPGASSFRVQVSDDNSFSTVVLDTSLNTSSCLFQTLQPNTTYYWRMKAFVGIDSTAFSDAQTFLYFVPIHASGLKYWLRSDSNLTYNAGTQQVEKWQNIVDTSEYVSQSNTTFQPLRNDSALNEHAAIQFNGNERLDFNTFIAERDFSVFSVSRVSSLDFVSSTSTRYILLGTQTVAAPRIMIGFGNIHSSLANEFFGMDAATSFSPLVQAFAGTTNNLDTVFNVLALGADSSNQTFVEVNAQASQNISNGTFDIDNSLSLNIDRMGQHGTSSDFFFEGEVMELLIYENSLMGDEKDNVYSYFANRYSSPLWLGKNIHIAYGFCDTMILAGDQFSTYAWSTGATSSSITVNTTGAYAVAVTDVFGFTTMDTIEVSYAVNPSFVPAADTTICLGDTIVLNTALDTSIYDVLWSTGATDSVLEITTAGDYWVTVTDSFGCFIVSDTLHVVVDSFPVQVSLGPDRELCQGSSFGLTSGASQAVTYLWSTTETTALAMVGAAGEYRVEVTDSIGCVGRDTLQVTIGGIAPTVNFSVQTPCVNSNTQFTDASTTSDGGNVVAWSWDFGDGATSTAQNPSNNYASNTSYTVTLEITTDSGCVNAAQQMVDVYQNPSANFSVVTAPVCQGATIQFNDNSVSTDGAISSYAWDFGQTGNADTSSLQNPSYTIDTVGSSNVQLTVVSTNGCEGSVTNAVFVNASPEANFTFANQCLDDVVQFTDSSLGNVIQWDWDFGDALLNLQQDEQNPTHQYAEPGTYVVLLEVMELNGCMDTTTLFVEVYDKPIAQFDGAEFCVPGAYQFSDSTMVPAGEQIANWKWEVIDQTYLSEDQNPSFNFVLADTGVHFLQLKVTTANGCIDSSLQAIVLYPNPVSDFSISPSVGIPPFAVELSNLSEMADSYAWDFGNGTTSTDQGPTAISYEDTGSYEVTLVVQTSNGCSDTSAKTVLSVPPLIDIAVTSVDYSFVSGTNFLTLSAGVTNRGTAPVTEFNILGDPSNALSVMERWSGMLEVSNTVNITFDQFFRTSDGALPDVVCVRTITPEGITDIVAENDEMCVTSDQLLLANVYPTPTDGNVVLEYILPETDQVEINLYDLTGTAVVQLFSGEGQEGFNRKSFDLATVNEGIYFIKILFQDTFIRQKVVLHK